MIVQRKRFRRTSSLAVAVFTILTLGMLFASSASAAQGVDITVADDQCTVTVTFEDQDGATGTVTATAMPPTDEDGVVFQDTVDLDANGDGSITFTLQFTGEPGNGAHSDEFHVRVEADSDPGQDQRVFWGSDCPDPVPPTTPPTTPPDDGVPPPVGGVDTGTAAGRGPSPILPVIGLVLLVGSTLWMRRRSTS
jgi:hypothetical protein